LRRSVHARGDSLDDVITEATKLEREANDSDFTELLLLMQKSHELLLRSMPACDELCQTVDLIRRNQLLRAEHESLSVHHSPSSTASSASANLPLSAIGSLLLECG